MSTSRLKRNPNPLHWETNPLLQVLCLFILGKVSYDFLKPDFLFTLIFLLFCSLLMGILGRRSHWTDAIGPKVQMWRQAAFWITFFIGGVLISSTQYQAISLPFNEGFVCKIEENYGQNANGKLRCLAQIKQIRTRNNWVSYAGKVLLQFADSVKENFQNGDQLLVSKELVQIERPSIPGQFDAKEYYRRKGIDYQVFVSGNDFVSSLGSDPNPVVLFSHQLRNWMEIQINRTCISENDGSMLTALLLGIRRKIDPELKAAYSAAGVTHILAVSGMHVGLIFVFLVAILGWLKRIPYGHILFSVAVIVFLWLYAMVTGLSPSVLRAVTVFSIIQLGELLKKPGLPINGLCLATILLFLFDVEIIYDVGYQLSFAAVYGIISFDRPIQNLIRTRNWFSTYLWQSCTITIAATLATFPLIIYYFHQFPIYFLLANLLAVPISNALIYCGIAFLIVSPFEAISKLIAWLIHFLIICLNQCVVWISRLPFSTLEQIFIPLPVLAFLLGFLVFFQLWILRSRHKMLINSLYFALLFVLGLLSYQIALWNRSYNLYAIRTKKEWMIAQTSGRNASITLLASDTIKGQTSFEIKSLKEGFQLLKVASHCSPGRIVSFNKNNPEKKSVMVHHHGKTFLFLGNYLKFNPYPGKKVQLDYLIVKEGGFKTIENALQGLQPREIWVDWPQKKLTEWAGKNPGYKILNFRSERFVQL